MIGIINEIHVRVLYLIFGVLNFVSSCLAIIFVEAEIIEKIFGFIGLNIIFLMFYFFYKGLIKYKGEGNLAWPIFGGPMKFLFGSCSILFSFFMIYVFMQNISKFDEKELYFSFGIPASLFLGGISVLVSLKSEK